MTQKRKVLRSYDFSKMKRGEKRNFKITAADPVIGIRALTAAYQYARRHNASCKKKSEHVKFSGSLSKTGTVRTIHRVQ